MRKLATRKNQVIRSSIPRGGVPKGARGIPLTQGKFAIVDAKDFEKVNRYNWGVFQNKRGGHYIPQAYVWNDRDNPRRVSLSRLLFPKQKRFWFRNHNPLDFRRSNIISPHDVHQFRVYKTRPPATSVYRGVTKTTYGKWKLTISSSTERQAAELYDLCAKVVFGDDALLNFP